MLSKNTLPKTSKVLAWAAMINGVLCLASPFILWLVVKAPVMLGATLIYFASAAVTFSAGFFGLRRQQWAFWLLCGFFALQLIEYKSESTYFSLIGPLSLKIVFIWANPAVAIKFNLLAILVVVLAGKAALQILEQDNEGRQGNAPAQADQGQPQ
jgi:hypothetical protein